MAKKKKRNLGLPPGSIIFTGNKKVEKVQVHYLKYNEHVLEESVLDNRSTFVLPRSEPELVQWYDVRGLHDTKLIEQIGKAFKVHPLVMEDIADIYQRPKVDEYPDGIFVTLKALNFRKKERRFFVEEVALYLGPGFLISFQEKSDDLFVLLRQRLINSMGRIRKKGADYLLYALIDLIIDQYFATLEEVEDVIEALEQQIIDDQTPEYRAQMYELRQELSTIRKTIIPLRDLTNSLLKIENGLIQEHTEVFLRDLKDQVFQVVDLLESYKDNLLSLQDLYISELSFKMNGVMKLLTIMSTIFIPLTFLSGIYGMNFVYMPELAWKYSYFVLLGTMGLMVVLMIWYFKKQKWL